MSRLFGALVALFLCLAPAAAQTCVTTDSFLERVTAAGRVHRVVEAGPILEHLRRLFAETPPVVEPPPATRAIVVDLPAGIVIVYLVQDMACSPLVIAESPEARAVRILVFGERV